MKVLFLSSDSPLPIIDGMRLRTYHLLSRMAQKHEITLLSFYRSIEDQAGLKQLADLMERTSSIPGVHRSSLMDYVKGSLSPMPFYVERSKSNAMQEIVSWELESCHYDLVFVNEMRMAHYVVPYGSVPRVIDAIDAFSNLYRRAFCTAKSLGRRAHYLQLWLKTQWYETRTYNRFDLCTVVSPVDAVVLRKNIPDLNVAVVPNGVDVSYFHPAEAVSEDNNTLVFVGVMDYPPNIDAVQYFANDILPLVRQKVPSVRFLVVGRNGSLEALGLQNTNDIEVTGAVPDIRAYVWQSAVFVCPMQFTSGVKNKVLEAMAMAKPVVGTPLAYEGLDVVPGEHVLSASTAQGFADSIVDLLSRRQRRVEIGRKARELVERRYSWQTAGDQLDVLLQMTAAEWRKRH